MHTWNDPARPVEERVAALLAELTVEEKAGQLGSYWPPATGTLVSANVAPMEGAAPTVSWSDAIAHGLGHLTRVFGTEPIDAPSGVERLRSFQRDVVARSRVGIPAIAHEECLTGFTTYGATIYPAAIAWGATFDPDLIRDMAHAIGSDLRAVGVHQGLSPLLDVVRDYRWGRVEETIGEDPYLVAVLGTAYVRGLQEAGIIATLKHFAGYSAARGGRNHGPVAMGPREFEDAILAPFEMAVREGAVGSVMNSYSDIDGVPAASNPDLLTGTLRDRWGFTGTVVSDYSAVSFLESMHRVAATLEEAGVLSLSAGVDIELPNTQAYAGLAAAVRSGALAAETLDRAVTRTLRQKIELGLLDEGYDPATEGGPVELDSARNRDLALRVAQESIVLLRNTGVLPLPPQSSVAVLGPCAGDAHTLMGCYAFPNHVLPRYPDLGLGVEIVDLVAGLEAELGADRVAHSRGVPVLDPDRSGIPQAVAAALNADVVVLAVGDRAGLFGLGTSGEGCDAADLTLPGAQVDLVEAVLATGTPTVLVIVSGRPYAVGAFAPRCAAIVQAFMPGEEGGTALAGILSGRVNPSGKLPVGVPAHPGGQPGTYLVPPLGWFSDGISNLDPRPLYPFGHGLSYTTFAISDLVLDYTEVPTDGVIEAAVTVTNTGPRVGTEVVQVYLDDVQAQVTRPVKELIGFARVDLDAETSARVTFTIHMDRTSFTGVRLRRIVEPGAMRLLVGTSSEDLPLAAAFTIVGQVREVPEGRVLTTPVRISPLIPSHGFHDHTDLSDEGARS